MSDEEKKSFDNLLMLKYFTMEKEDKQSIETILNLVERQQKEIEELKEKNRNITKEIVDFVNSHYISKDRIEAKIEELNNKMINETESLENFYKLKYCYEVLQSLLEEEV